jgi:small subunit ribosomal protein S4
MQRVKVGKRSRSLGVALTTKGGRILERRQSPPGQHGKSRRPSKSDFGKQLFEKQKLKAQYNVSEKQLRNYFAKASRSKTATGTALLQLLEARLDMAVHRAGFAPTIYAARQLVSHGHMIVNGKRVKAPSYHVLPGAVIAPAPKKDGHPLIKQTFGASMRPNHITIVDQENYQVRYDRAPERPEIPIICDEQQVVEFYSR